MQWTTSQLCQRAGRPARRAFTLVELIVAISIMALMASLVALAMVPFMKGRSLSSGARTVQAMIYQARTYAATQRCNATLYFNSVDRSITLFNSPTGVPSTIDNRVDEPEFLPHGVKFNVAGSGPQNVVHRTSGSSSRKVLVFSPSGSLDPSAAGMAAVGNWEIRLVRENAVDEDDDGLIGEDAPGGADYDEQKVLEIVFASGLVRVSDQ